MVRVNFRVRSDFVQGPLLLTVTLEVCATNSLLHVIMRYMRCEALRRHYVEHKSGRALQLSYRDANHYILFCDSGQNFRKMTQLDNIIAIIIFSII